MANNLMPLFATDGNLHEPSLQVLTDVLQNNSLPGFDYIEFKQSLQQLAKMNMDLPTAIKSAFITASTVGLTKEKLIETAAHYKSLVIKEKEQFDASLQRQQDQRIAAKLKEIAVLKQQITDGQAKIKALESDINGANAAIRDADLEIEGSRGKIDSAKENFMAAYANVLGQIDSDIDAINRNL